MSDSPKTYHRNATSEDKTSGNVQREVSKLIGKGVVDHEAWYKIKSRFGNNPDLMNAIYEGYKEKFRFLLKKANKFKTSVYSKYGGTDGALSQADLVRKAKKYASKYKLSDDDFNMFFILVTKDRHPLSSLYSVPNSKMAQTFGYDIEMTTASKMNVKEADLKEVEEILKLHGETKNLHAQVVMQSLTYVDCAPQAITGKFNSEKFNGYSFIHPVMAALFLPKFNMLDESILIANIGSIVERKNKGEPLMTKPDFELYWAMVTDPNDIVCTSNDSAVKDLNKRFKLQTKIWDCVLQLRQGRYYHEQSVGSTFMSAVDDCRSSLYDAPDLTYVKDEGTILRRILNAFSLRPTIVSINRLHGTVAGVNYGYGSAMGYAGSVAHITTVPMITLRLPLTFVGGNTAVDLQESLSQPQWFVENKMIVPKTLQLVHSRGMLFFYVGRRFQTINVSRLNTPYNFSALPMTVAGWETLNEHPVNYQQTMVVMNDVFNLRSVVVVEKMNVKGKSIITGNSACILTQANASVGYTDEAVIQYDPQLAILKLKDPADGYVKNDPITVIPNRPGINFAGGMETFSEKATKRGTIFVYQKMTDNRDGVIPM